MSEDVKNKIKTLGRSFLEVKEIRGVEINLFYKDGTKINYNSRDDTEVTNE